MKISVEKLVEIVVAEVLAELSRRGVVPTRNGSPAAPAGSTVHVVDMSGYRSPVLLESHLLSLAVGVREVVVPEGTVVTPGARDLIKKRRLILKNGKRTT